MVTHLLRQIPALHTADSAIATAAAICCAMVSNYALDNAWAFGVARHRWGLPWLAGFASFALVCTAGAVINWSVTIGIRHATGMHMNVYFAQMVGIAVATLWNYALNTRITWKSPT
jgi:dolichol-phosphate mannosyltransferase